mmetsp:Transcript_4268/g.7482  ORF Transcript_4268/g.7482 Transcript_4268/m.7482 type:complete len:224 (-) Transcript_4268:591-1262(-)
MVPDRPVRLHALAQDPRDSVPTSRFHPPRSLRRADRHFRAGRLVVPSVPGGVRRAMGGAMVSEAADQASRRRRQGKEGPRQSRRRRQGGRRRRLGRESRREGGRADGRGAAQGARARESAGAHPASAGGPLPFRGDPQGQEGQAVVQDDLAGRPPRLQRGRHPRAHLRGVALRRGVLRDASEELRSCRPRRPHQGAREGPSRRQGQGQEAQARGRRWGRREEG